MPVEEPGGTGGGAAAYPARRLYTSVTGHHPLPPNSDPDKTHSTLVEIDRRATGREERLTTIKHLRVMVMAVDSPREREELNTIRRDFYKTYARPRLSRVAEAIGVAYPPTLEEHLDVDWFSTFGNWWPKSSASAFDGARYEQKVARALLGYLERSMQLAPSDGHPESWTWHGPKLASWRNDLEGQTAPRPELLQMSPIKIEWLYDDTATSLSVQEVGGAFRLNTPRPIDQNGINIS